MRERKCFSTYYECCKMSYLTLLTLLPQKPTTGRTNFQSLTKTVLFLDLGLNFQDSVVKLQN